MGYVSFEKEFRDQLMATISKLDPSEILAYLKAKGWAVRAGSCGGWACVLPGAWPVITLESSGSDDYLLSVKRLIDQVAQLENRRSSDVLTEMMAPAREQALTEMVQISEEMGLYDDGGA